MNPLPVTAIAPLAEISIDTGPFRTFMQEQLPCNTSIDDISVSVRSVGYGLAVIPPVY
jgi:hypothetical protein